MKQEEAEQYRQKLEEEIVKVQQEIESLEESNQPVSPDNAIGRISRMDAINNKTMIERGVRESRVKQQRLQSALAKYGTDSFGKCVRCESEIQLARLMFMPHALTCVHCAGR